MWRFKEPGFLIWFFNFRERDQDKDGKLNFQEFFNGLFSLVRAHDEVETTSHETDSSGEAPAKKLFSQLDKDKDGYALRVVFLILAQSVLSPNPNLAHSFAGCCPQMN